jgi:REP element-mobilizing transposase RayT
MPDALAFLLTWTTYGTWLHGDERGSIERVGRTSRVLDPNASLEAHERDLLSHRECTLDGSRRDVVRAAITRHCEFRGWCRHALAVRTNHVHVVVSCRCPPDRAMIEFKAYATRALRDEGLVGREQHVWSRHGSTRHLHFDEALHGAIRYVLEGQGPEPRR